MQFRYILALALALMVAGTTNAQKKQKAKAKKPVVQVKQEVSAADLLYENMTSSIQRVMVIDSVVVDVDNFFEEIPLPSNCGQLMATTDFLQKKEVGTAFINEFGNKAYFSSINQEGISTLMTKDKLQNQWSEENVVEGLDQQLSLNYPFMMPDGTTLYFAQKGEESLGGYDIFVTRYNSEEGRFFNPENIGLPFNSKANDYMYVEDELNELGWFVTDRNQPEGKVCVYTFVPLKKRVNYDTDEMDDEEIGALASIRSIRETWFDNNELQAAHNRLQRLRDRNQKSIGNNTQELFVVNDHITYTSAKQFRSNDARRMYEELMKTYEELKLMKEELGNLRSRYYQANGNERKKMSTTILSQEEKVEQLTSRIRELEKAVRNNEVSALNP